MRSVVSRVSESRRFSTLVVRCLLRTFLLPSLPPSALIDFWLLLSLQRRGFPSFWTRASWNGFHLEQQEAKSFPFQPFQEGSFLFETAGLWLVWRESRDVGEGRETSPCIRRWWGGGINKSSRCWGCSQVGLAHGWARRVGSEAKGRESHV